MHTLRQNKAMPELIARIFDRQHKNTEPCISVGENLINDLLQMFKGKKQNLKQILSVIKVEACSVPGRLFQ